MIYLNLFLKFGGSGGSGFARTPAGVQYCNSGRSGGRRATGGGTSGSIWIETSSTSSVRSGSGTAGNSYSGGLCGGCVWRYSACSSATTAASADMNSLKNGDNKGSNSSWWDTLKAGYGGARWITYYIFK